MHDYNGEKFLDKLYSNLYMSDEVQHTKQNTDKRYESIKRYLERLERVHKKANTKTKKELVKSLYYDKYVVNEDVLREKIKKINDYINDERIKEEIDNIRNAQKRSLDKWLNYLMDEHSNYPMWAKYWAFQGMLKMGVYDEGIEGYQKRSKDTEAPFVDANPEIIANAISLIEKCISKKEINDEELEKIITSGNFSKIYTILERRYKDNIIEYSTTEGIWIKYNQGSKEDAIKLSKSLQGKNTHWCTADESTAIHQVCGPYDTQNGGDFYVYYTKDKKGEYTLPRIAMRMNEHDEIGEIRGIEEGQNLEEEMIPILEEKLHSMSFVEKEDIEDNLKIVYGLKELSTIYKKTIKDEKLTQNELKHLYTKEYGFGWGPDPLVDKIISKRDTLSDYNNVKNKQTKINIIFTETLPLKSISDKEIILEAIDNYKEVLKYASNEVTNDKKTMLKIVKIDALGLGYASKNLQNDKDVVKAAIKEDGIAIQYASDRIKGDKEIARDAVRSNGYAWTYLSNELQNDKDIIIDACRNYSEMVKVMPNAVKEDKDIMIAIIKKTAYALRFASDKLKDDKDVVMTAIKLNGSAIKFASDRLKGDRELALMSVRELGRALDFLPEKFQDDEEIVLEAIKEDGWALHYASDRLRNIRSIALAAAKRSIDGFCCIPKRFFDDKEIVLEAAKKDGLIALHAASDRLKDDKDVVLESVKKTGMAIRYASLRLKFDEEVALEAIKEDEKALDSIIPELLKKTGFKEKVEQILHEKNSKEIDNIKYRLIHNR